MSALTDIFDAIANAIRSKKGVSTTYKPSEMAAAISSISTGTDTSDATLDSGSRMLSGYTAYAKGTKYTGNISTRSVSSRIGVAQYVSFNSGYYPNSFGVYSAYDFFQTTSLESVVKNISICDGMAINHLIMYRTNNGTPFTTSSFYVEIYDTTIDAFSVYVYTGSTRTKKTISKGGDTILAVANQDYDSGSTKFGFVSFNAKPGYQVRVMACSAKTM